VAFGQTLAWGMYVVGLGLTMLLLVPMYGIPPVFGTLLEIGFEGGHGTAAGMAETFKAVGWEEGTDLALGVATVGVVMGVLLGMLLINWAVRRGHTVLVTTVGQWTEPTLDADLERERVDVPAATGRFAIQSIEPVSLHVAYLGVAIAIGALLRQGLIWLEAATLGEWGVAPLVAHTPLFPLAMIGGLIVQQLHDRFLPQLALQRATYVRLQGVALDYLIVAALASLSLGTLAAHWQPLVILMTAGILWAVGVLLLLGPRVFPSYWFERSIGDFGQSLGVTATGLLLMKIVDPEYRSPAFEAFGYKQLLFEPFLGGGLVTAMAVPLVANYGPWPLFFTSLGLCVFWIAFGLLLFGSKRDKPE
jgi:ESS family glutamate:Na+ symporter